MNTFNPLNAELNPICYLLALLGAHLIFHVSRIRVNLMQVVDFPTRIINNNGTLIDTIFVDTMIYDKIQIKPFINGLSDHDAQIICLHNVNIGLQQNVSKKKTRLINEQTIKHFPLSLQRRYSPG